jgi:CHAT domain-containing protein
MNRLRRAATAAWLLAGLLAAAAGAQEEPGVLEQRARQASERGHLHDAAALWRDAARAYDESGERTSRLRALLRQGEAERDLGHPALARETLGAAVELAGALGEPGLEAAARGALASALAAAGDTGQASVEARRAEALARERGDPALRAAVAHQLAGVLAAASESAQALDAYDRAARMADEAGDASLAFRARVEAAALAARDATDATDEAPRRIARARAAGSGLQATRGHAYAWARLGRAAHALGDPAARADLDHALAMARALGDPGALSWALGSLAALARDAGDPATALPLAREALLDARRARLPDAELAWLALVGRLERDAGDRDAAIAHLADASERLAERRAAVTGYRAGEVSTVYIDLVDLLLARARAQRDAELAARDLRAAQRALERFKVQELRDYFRDDCVDAYRETVRDAASASPTAAILYPVALTDRLEILVSSREGIRQFRADVPAGELDALVADFRRQLTIRTSRQYLLLAQRLYAVLVAPARAYLDELGVDTLVFVPGGALRTIPMAALHDGERFLIERYAVATTPGLELTDPKPVDRESLNAFLGGLSESVQGYAPLPHVREELARARDILGGGEVLVDEDFTVRRVQQELDARPFNVVHIATHGEFGSRAEDFFLLTHEGRLTLDELATSVGAFRFREKPLELIFLSACDTAAGDARAALGLAGVAVRAGARSAVGSLWTVSDEATALLVEAFYRALREPGVSRAEALRRAQRALLADRRYRHPAYWSAFLLINSWL